MLIYLYKDSKLIHFKNSYFKKLKNFLFNNIFIAQRFKKIKMIMMIIEKQIQWQSFAIEFNEKFMEKSAFIIIFLIFI